MTRQAMICGTEAKADQGTKDKGKKVEVVISGQAVGIGCLPEKVGTQSQEQNKAKQMTPHVDYIQSSVLRISCRCIDIVEYKE